MKKLILITGILLLGFGAKAQFTKATLQATGLTCAMCSNAINKALEKVPFVESVRSDIKNSAFNIVFRADAKVNIDDLKEAVEDAGFSVGSLKMTGNFPEQDLVKDKHFKIGDLNFHFLNEGSWTLQGEQTLTVVDKDYVTAKEFRKYSSTTKHACYRDGRAGDCCNAGGITTGSRVYHVKI
jgi:copper chaperone CopZ